MPPKLQNAFLAKRDAQQNASHQYRLHALSELCLMAMLIAAHNKLNVGPGRAPGFLLEYVAVKEEIAKTIQEDIGDSYKKNGNGDREFLHTKKDLAPTTSLDHGHGANRPQECVVVEVNAAKLWYRVRFASGFSECYRVLEG